MPETESTTLLTRNDPCPLEIVNGNSRTPILLVCEHAGRAVPEKLGDLGVSQSVIDSHRGWDPGAGAVARGVAERLNAPLVLVRYSRLVIDSNRPPGSPTSIPVESDGETIPGNCGISQAQKESRIEAIFNPFESAVQRLFDEIPRRACFSIHSFTPTMNGESRPWHAGILNRRNPETVNKIVSALCQQCPDMVVGANEPYQISDDTDWFIPAHAERLGLVHGLIEIRNDQISDGASARFWSRLLSSVILQVVEEQP